MPINPETIPEDLIIAILEHLSAVDRRDLTQFALLSKQVYHVTIPLLYRELDSRVRTSKNGTEHRIVHPSQILLQKPEYFKYVRSVREQGMVGAFEPSLMPGCREALSRCTNLRSFTWNDNGHDTSNDADLLTYLDILQKLPITELIIRTSSGISDEVWDKLCEFRNLRKVAIWCLHGNPRVLQGWSEKLGDTLTDLELGRCAGVPATILVSVLSQLPNLQSLRLKGAPSNSIPEILSTLPKLVALDTEYFGSGLSINRYSDEPIAALKELTVRTSSVDAQGPQHLWSWIRRLIPYPSLESLTLNTFSTQGDFQMPRMFILDLAKTHQNTLKQFTIDTVLLTLEDLQCLCTKFPLLEALSCSIAWCRDTDHIKEIIAHARNLRRMKLHVNWVRGPGVGSTYFSAVEAKDWMLMLGENSKLRVIVMGQVLYTGQWVYHEKEDGTGEAEFEVLRDVAHDSWI
ncbi:hypothetical protein C8Q75DRAFT_774574 [Abortiporus biennis]|nr:hypothetical protein C8Q75DRAFT_774574 [Abortiporus biennis]